MAINREQLRDYCLNKIGVTHEFPFGPDVEVYKVLGKMFALIPTDDPLSISLKCDPTLAEILRDNYSAVTPGYHLNKRHWNTVVVDEEVPDDELLSWVDDSYALVVAKLKKVERERLKQMGEE